MSIGDLVKDASKKVRDATFDYVPDYTRMSENRTKALVGFSTIGALYIAPGDHPTLASVALAYGCVKGYQAVRDWAGK